METGNLPTTPAMVPSVKGVTALVVNGPYTITYNPDVLGWKAEYRYGFFFKKNLTERGHKGHVSTYEEAAQDIEYHKKRLADEAAKRVSRKYKVTFDPARAALGQDAWKAFVRFGPFWICISDRYEHGSLVSNYAATREDALTHVERHKLWRQREREAAVLAKEREAERKRLLKAVPTRRIQTEYL